MTDFSEEAQLLQQLREGKKEAFIHLVDKYNQRLFAYALTMTNEESMAQDLIQNVFLKTWEKRKRLQIKKSVQNFLFKMVYNEFINQYKKNRATMLLEQKYFESLEKVTNSYQDNLFEKRIEKITIEIQKLPPKCREVFLLSREEGLTNLEISDYLKITTKTVEAHITKAFNLLRKAMDNKVDLNMFLLFTFKGQYLST